MKRPVALVLLLVSLGLFAKLAFKAPADRLAPPPVPTTSTPPPPPRDLDAEIRAKYPDDRELVDRVLDRYRITARQIEASDGLRGLKLLDRLDLEAVFLYEKYPSDFRRLSSLVGDDAAADLLLSWKDYLGLKHADERDRQILITELGRLGVAERRQAARHPEALPLLLADPEGMRRLIDRYERDPERLREILGLLSYLSLDTGPAELRAALRTIDDRGDLVIESCRLIGLEGLALVQMFGPVLDDLGDSFPLSHALIALRMNSDWVEDQLRARSPDSIARLLRHAESEGILPQVASSSYGLALISDFDESGVAALRAGGADAADLAYQDYSDPTLRLAVVEGIAETGQAGLAVLAKYAEDQEFREILRRDGAAVLPPIIRADFAPEMLAHLAQKTDRSAMENLAYGISYLSGESGQGMIRTIRDDGLDRVRQLQTDGVAFQELLPLYDILHLGNVVRRGYSPTKGEMAWAAIDGCFVVMDAVSLLAIQPEGVAAAEVARSELKATAREAAQSLSRQVVNGASDAARRELGREVTAQAVEASTERAARWWLVRSAGGAFEVLRRTPEALSRMTLEDVTRMARPLCDHAGLRLTRWRPLSFMKNGRLVKLPVPAQIGLRHLQLDAAQAGVGWVAIHKMEEHLASRRPGERPSAADSL